MYAPWAAMTKRAWIATLPAPSGEAPAAEETLYTCKESLSQTLDIIFMVQLHFLPGPAHPSRVEHSNLFVCKIPEIAAPPPRVVDWCSNLQVFYFSVHRQRILQKDVQTECTQMNYQDLTNHSTILNIIFDMIPSEVWSHLFRVQVLLTAQDRLLQDQC